MIHILLIILSCHDIYSLQICIQLYYYSWFIKILVPFCNYVSSLFRTPRKWWTAFFSLFILSWSRSLFSWRSRSRSFFIFLFGFFFLLLLTFSSFLLSPLKGILTFWSLLRQILWVLLIHSLKQFFFKGFREWFYMHVIAISTPFAATVNILFAFGI